MQEADGLDKKQSSQSSHMGEQVMRNPEGDPLPSSPRVGLQMLLSFVDEQGMKVASSREDRGLEEIIDQQNYLVQPFCEEKSQELPMGAQETNLARPPSVSPIVDVSSINLLQLTELIRGLSEEEYNFLIESSRIASGADPIFSSLILRDHGFRKVFERLKEELFLAFCMKDLFNLHLAEQFEQQLESDNHCYQLINELSELRTSCNNVSKKNQLLAEELSNCRVEMHDITSKSVELQSKYLSAEAEIEARSIRALELQNCYEMSQKEALDLSRELTDCRELITALNAKNKGLNESVALMIEEKKELVEENERHLCEIKKLSTELTDIKSSDEELKTESLNLNGGLSLVTEEKNKIEAEIQHLSHEIDRLSMELVESRDFSACLQVENSNLNGSLAQSFDQAKMLEEDKQAAILENQIFLSQIIVLQEQLSIEIEKQMKNEVELKEATLQLEQVTEENFFLKSTLDAQRANTEEIGNKYSQLLSRFEELCSEAQLSGKRSEGHQIKTANYSFPVHLKQDGKGDTGEPMLNLLEHKDFYNSIGFVALKMRLDEMENTLEKLENAIDQLHSHSVSFGRSSGKISSAGISNLIKAFESKSPKKEIDVEEDDPFERQVPPDPFMSTKEKIGELRASLTKWRLDVQNAGALFKEEQDGRKRGEAKDTEFQYLFESLNQHCLNLEASNIELTVQYEVSRQLLVDLQESKSHLEKLVDALNQDDLLLKAKNVKLCGKLKNFESKISDLVSEINDVQKSSNEMTSTLGIQLENLQREVADRAMFLEQGWNTTIAKNVEATGKLDESVGEALLANTPLGCLDGLDINHRFEVSVNAATKLIVDLKKKLEATYTENEMVHTSFREVSLKCDDLLEKNDLAVGILQKIYSDLGKLVLNHVRPLDIPSDALPDPMNYSNYETIMRSLDGLLKEKLELESVFKEVKSELSCREKELEESSINYVGLDVSKLIEDIERVLNVEDNDTKLSRQPLLYLSSLVSSLVQKTSEVDMQVRVAKEDYGSKMQELTELQAKMYYLDALHLEHENSILILKECLRDAEEALIASRSQLYEKTRKLDELEQRVFSIREKLSIAVSKGKGLVVQRDGLRQSLDETSSELDRCLQELQLKGVRIHEVETKLKTYAEAGERVEALESELSYIRHSSNALRESFLVKDSVLQRIEEILEDLSMPKQFHSLDIIDKIDWLARSAVGNTLPSNDCDQKSTAGEDSYSDAGLVVVDAWKDDGQFLSNAGDDLRKKPENWKDEGHLLSDAGDDLRKNFEDWKDDGQLLSDAGDDLRKKFEDLKSKYYELAEQNEMLEQSLMERNKLVHRWQELMDRIDMPGHLRSMEIDGRIEWLGRALVGANHHIDSLQMKIEKYDSYCGLLNADMEEAQRRVSALQAELRAVTSEREHLFEKYDNYCGLLNADLEESQRRVFSLQAELRAVTSERGQLFEKAEALMCECKKLSMLLKQAELENEKLHNEITNLEERLEQKCVVEEQILIIKGKISKLQDLVSDVLQGSKTENLMSSNDSIDTLQVFLKMLVEHYATLLSEKQAYCDEKDLVIVSLRKDLEEALCELMHVKTSLEERLEQKCVVEEQILVIEGKISKLQDLVNDVLQGSKTENQMSSNVSIDTLEVLLKMLVEHYATLLSEKQVHCDQKDVVIVSLRKDLEEALCELMHVKTSSEERLEQKCVVEEQILVIEGKINKLQDLISDVLQGSKTKNLMSSNDSIDSLEVLLKMLVEHYATLLSEKQAYCDEKDLVVVSLRKDLEEALCEMIHVKTSLEERLEQKCAAEEQILIIQGKISKLQDLVLDVLQGSKTENLMSSNESIDTLEVLLKMLVEHYATLLSENQAYCDQKDLVIVSLRKDLEEALCELMHVKEERDRNLESQTSLSSEVEALIKKTEELQELLNQEEQRSTSVREKLNVAVRKGKSLIQQRDSLKQTIEEMNSEMACLKYEISNQEKTLAEYAQKVKDLSTYPDRLEALESESLHLKNHLAETEHHLQEREHMMKMILNKLSDIEVSGDSDTSDPVKKLELVGKFCSDLRASVTSLEQECRKSKRAEGLLVAELNEVQERNDTFEEELAKVAVELENIRKERDSALASKMEALSHLEKLSALHIEERSNYFSELLALRSSMKQLHTSFGEIGELLANVLFMDLESSRKLEVGLKSCMNDNNVANVVDLPANRGCDGVLPMSIYNKKRAISMDSWLNFDEVDRVNDIAIIEICHLLGHWLQDFLIDVTSLKESLNRHSSLTQEQKITLSNLVVTIQRQMTSQRESYEALNNEISEKDKELAALFGNVTYLYEACTNSVVVIEHGKDELVGIEVESSDLGMKAPSFVDDEKYIKAVADRLLFAAKEFATVKSDFLDANQKEMKAAITNLQRELQEKDVQRERICLELVNQIKDAESAANSCTQDLQASKIQENNLEKQVEKLEAERKILEQKVHKLEDTQLAAAELEEKIRSLTGLVSAKDQEIEALMHALDEEGMQMEELTKKSEELENLCDQKNQEIKKLETSRSKLMKKHSITISKFDELHDLSANLLGEIEKLRSQLQERDAEISFLRQEVTRCTNDILLASQLNKTSSDEILELHKKLISLLSELENLRADAESKGALLEEERKKVDELAHKVEALETSLHAKESQLNLLEVMEESGRGASMNTTSEILEVEPVMDNWTAPVTSSATPQVRSMRKGNNDHVAIAVDVDSGSASRTIEDEDDDKVHGFKSLTTSRIVPKFTRPLSDMVDGLWVSCERTLMRQPTLRLGIIIYWAIVHLLLAFSVA